LLRFTRKGLSNLYQFCNISEFLSSRFIDNGNMEVQNQPDTTFGQTSYKTNGGMDTSKVDSLQNYLKYTASKYANSLTGKHMIWRMQLAIWLAT